MTVMCRNRRKRMIEKSKAAKEGRRMHAFYVGFWAARRGGGSNPFPAGSEKATCWQAGWEFAQETQQ